jgi:hypothetical protein
MMPKINSSIQTQYAIPIHKGVQNRRSACSKVNNLRGTFHVINYFGKKTYDHRSKIQTHSPGSVGRHDV